MTPEQYAPFVERLLKSSLAVFAVAYHSHKNGHAVEIPALKIAPAASVARQYVDRGDLLLNRIHSVQVKRLGFVFSDATDYPYPEVIVANRAAANRAGDVLAFVLVSADLRNMAIVHKRTRPQWYVREIQARNCTYPENFYFCPLELISFKPLTFLEDINANNPLPR